MRTLFVDRDGVVNVRIVDGYVMEPQQFLFVDGAIEALRRLRARFDTILLVTNQQCVGKGLCTMAQIDQVHDYMQQQLRAHEAAFDKIYCCPHLAADHCTCRKPLPGMAQQAKQDFPAIDFAQSVMVGDALSDLQFAVNAGLMPVHVGDLRPTEIDEVQKITPHHFDTLLQFARAESTISNY